MQRAVKTVILLCRYFILILGTIFNNAGKRGQSCILHVTSPQAKESMEKGGSAGQGGGTRRGLMRVRIDVRAC